MSGFREVKAKPKKKGSSVSSVKTSGPITKNCYAVADGRDVPDAKHNMQIQENPESDHGVFSQKPHKEEKIRWFRHGTTPKTDPVTKHFPAQYTSRPHVYPLPKIGELADLTHAPSFPKGYEWTVVAEVPPENTWPQFIDVRSTVAVIPGEVAALKNFSSLCIKQGVRYFTAWTPERCFHLVSLALRARSNLCFQSSTPAMFATRFAAFAKLHAHLFADGGPDWGMLPVPLRIEREKTTSLQGAEEPSAGDDIDAAKLKNKVIFHFTGTRISVELCLRLESLLRNQARSFDADAVEEEISILEDFFFAHNLRMVNCTRFPHTAQVEHGLHLIECVVNWVRKVDRDMAQSIWQDATSRVAPEHSWITLLQVAAGKQVHRIGCDIRSPQALFRAWATATEYLRQSQVLCSLWSTAHGYKRFAAAKLAQRDSVYSALFELCAKTIRADLSLGNPLWTVMASNKTEPFNAPAEHDCPVYGLVLPPNHTISFDCANGTEAYELLVKACIVGKVVVPEQAPRAPSFCIKSSLGDAVISSNGAADGLAAVEEFIKWQVAFCVVDSDVAATVDTRREIGETAIALSNMERRVFEKWQTWVSKTATWSIATGKQSIRHGIHEKALREHTSAPEDHGDRSGEMVHDVVDSATQLLQRMHLADNCCASMRVGRVLLFALNFVNNDFDAVVRTINDVIVRSLDSSTRLTELESKLLDALSPDSMERPVLVVDVTRMFKNVPQVVHCEVKLAITAQFLRESGVECVPLAKTGVHINVQRTCCANCSAFFGSFWNDYFSKCSVHLMSHRHFLGTKAPSIRYSIAPRLCRLEYLRDSMMHLRALALWFLADHRLQKAFEGNVKEVVEKLRDRQGLDRTLAENAVSQLRPHLCNHIEHQHSLVGNLNAMADELMPLQQLHSYSRDSPLHKAVKDSPNGAARSKWAIGEDLELTMMTGRCDDAHFPCSADSKFAIRVKFAPRRAAANTAAATSQASTTALTS